MAELFRESYPEEHRFKEYPLNNEEVGKGHFLKNIGEDISLQIDLLDLSGKKELELPVPKPREISLDWLTPKTKVLAVEAPEADGLSLEDAQTAAEIVNSLRFEQFSAIGFTAVQPTVEAVGTLKPTVPVTVTADPLFRKDSNPFSLGSFVPADQRTFLFESQGSDVYTHEVIAALKDTLAYLSQRPAGLQS